jgi:hypothetical protein
VEVLIVLAILFVVVFIVTGPLRRPDAGGSASAEGGAGSEGPAGEDRHQHAVDALARESRMADLEAAREAKYREIRDAQLDYDTGKLSRTDFEAIDGSLRAEALEILGEIDALQAAPDAPPPEPE